MNEEQLIQQVMFSAFCEELEKVAQERGVPLAAPSLEQFEAMRKEAGLIGDMASAIGKKARGAAVGLGLMSAPAADVGETGAKRVASFVQDRAQTTPAPAVARMRRTEKATPAITPQGGAPNTGDMTRGYMSYDEAMKHTGGDSRKAIAMTRGVGGGQVWRD